MIIYNPNTTSLAGPMMAPTSNVPFELLSKMAAVTKLLPKGGEGVLYTPDQFPPQSSKEATAAAEKLKQANVQAAVSAVALEKYLKGVEPLFDDYVARKSVMVNLLAARLKAWPELNGIFRLANSGYSLDFPVKVKVGATYSVMSGESYAKSLIKKIMDLMPESDDDATAAVKEHIAQLLPLIKDVKDKETDLFKAQVPPSVAPWAGGRSFKLYEHHVIGTNTTSIGWFGPVAVRDRVAVKDKIKDDKGKEQEVTLFPIPSFYLGKVNGTVNPDYYALTMPCFADFIGYDSYTSYGTNGQVNKESGDTTFDLIKAGQYDEAYGLLADMYARVTSGQKLSDVLFGISVSKDGKTQSVPVLSETSFGNMVATGLDLDPEWEEFKVSNTSLTVEDILANTAKAGSTRDGKERGVPERMRIQQDIYRTKLNARDSKGAPVGENAKLDNAIGALITAITFIGLFPPLPLKWVKESGKVLLTPVGDWDAWLKLYSSSANQITNNIDAQLEQLNKDVWGGKGPKYYDVILAAKNGALDKIIPPLVANLADLKAAQAEASSEAKAAMAGLDAGQTAYVLTRSIQKSTTLIAMKAAEFAVNAEEVSGDMVQTLIEMGDKLYGCKLQDPPSGMKDSDLIKWYTDQLKVCEKSPSPNSLKGKLDALLVKYNEVKAKADAGDLVALKQLNEISSQIASIQKDINGLVGTRVARRTRNVDNSTRKGGVLSFVSATNDILSTLPIATTNFGGVTVVPPAQEKGGAEQAKTDAAGAEASVKDGLAYTDAAGIALKDLINDSGIWVPAATTATIDKNNKKIEKILNKSSLWWLLLVAAAVAANNK
jgi:hypothetical protein